MKDDPNYHRPISRMRRRVAKTIILIILVTPWILGIAAILSE